MTRLVQATARVPIIIEVECRSCWGGDCTADQIHKQAAAEALDAVKFALQEAPQRQRITVKEVGRPVVMMTEETRV